MFRMLLTMFIHIRLYELNVSRYLVDLVSDRRAEVLGSYQYLNLILIKKFGHIDQKNRGQRISFVKKNIQVT